MDTWSFILAVIQTLLTWPSVILIIFLVVFLGKRGVLTSLISALLDTIQALGTRGGTIKLTREGLIIEIPEKLEVGTIPSVSREIEPGTPPQTADRRLGPPPPGTS